MTPVVIHPLGVQVVYAYLKSRSELTAIVGTRIYVDLPEHPTFPAVRVTGLSSPEIVPRVWQRLLVQVDCWHTTQPGAWALAETVRGVLRASANYMTATAVLGECEDVTVRPQETDTSMDPAVPRSIVTAHAPIRPR